MRPIYVSLVAVLVAAGARTAAGQTLPPDAHAGVAFKVGTLGAGLDVAFPIHPRLNVRTGFTNFGLTHDFNDEDMKVAAQFRLQSVTAALDWFPFGGGFHVSPGLMLYNGTSVTARMSVPAGRNFSLGDDDMVSSAANPIGGTMKVEFARTTPMLTLGWGNLLPRSKRHWSVPFELGVVRSGSPKASLNYQGTACNPRGTVCRDVASDPRLQRDLADEQAHLNRDLAGLKIIPAISLGFSYRF